MVQHVTAPINSSYSDFFVEENNLSGYSCRNCNAANFLLTTLSNEETFLQEVLVILMHSLQTYQNILQTTFPRYYMHSL